MTVPVEYFLILAALQLFLWARRLDLGVHREVLVEERLADGRIRFVVEQGKRTQQAAIVGDGTTWTYEATGNPVQPPVAAYCTRRHAFNEYLDRKYPNTAGQGEKNGPIIH